jgi:quercetin dioxygenase-like cupin family protein
MNNPEKQPGNELLASQVMNMKGMLEVQPGAVVSRTLMKQKTGTVTLFAFDTGEGLSEHTAPFDALVIGVEGQGEITIGGRGFPVGDNEMILMPANEPHSIVAREPFKMLLVMIRS